MIQSIAHTAVINLQRLERGMPLNWRKKTKWILQDRRIKRQTTRLKEGEGTGDEIRQFLLACGYCFNAKITTRREQDINEQLVALDGNVRGMSV